MQPDIGKYYRLHLDGKKARKALGENTDFYMDERPISYSQGWKPMNVDFYDAFGGGEKLIPDISSRVGKLFLNEMAFSVLKEILSKDGEFLPVTYEGGTGYLFNCLVVAEELIAIKSEFGFHDPLNDRFQ